MNIKDMQQELFKLAKTIPKSKRIGLLKEIPETKMHKYLKELFQKMEPNCLVEITHGSSELGKDLVIVKKDNLSMDAIGVIVKCGDFKAKTLGDIDELKDKINKAKVSGSKKISEINSQIEQAINHPAELENIIQKLQIDKLFCVIVGNISKQARTRIEKEVKDKIGIEIFDLDC